ncbi:MAG: site-specific recombinase XerD [Cognaticolwellia sp.]|jgi:site-specific recombinase XerD
MEHVNLSDNSPKVVKQTVNLGNLPYFSDVDDSGKRMVTFHQDGIVGRFPRVLSLTRVLDALEINLFLEHRYKGLFMPPKRGGKKNPLGGVSLVTINSLANSMSLFLQWIEAHDVDWHEVYAVSDSDKAKYWLPVYRYRKYLIDQIIAKKIDRDTANLYINHVRQFYEWARKQHRIEKLPFKYKTKVIKKKRKDGNIDLLFTQYGAEEKGFTITTTDLLIPKKYKQKKSTDASLSPYHQDELQLLYSSHALSKFGPRLRVDLAVQCGLRADEVATFEANHVVDPALSDQSIYYVTIVGKYDKERTIMVSKGLMTSLWLYRNDEEHQHRLSKWQLAKGSCDDAPLFLNRSGSFMSPKSIGNVISKVRKELKLVGKVLKRDFHDLRSTFATNLAGFLIHKNLPIGFVQFKLMQLMGHADFSTTQKYINFARSLTFDKQMASWVDKLFGEFVTPLQEDAFKAEAGTDAHA